MAAQFDLIEQPWIPVVRPEGSVDELGLLETLTQAHRIQDIYADTPLETVSLFRLLLAILHRIFGPPDKRAWGRLWRARRWGNKPIKGYLEQWRPRFDLFAGERPFYQEYDERPKIAPITRLAPHWASGNNATLFDHHMDDDEEFSVTPAKAARLVVATQSCGLAGLLGRGMYGTDAPAARGASFLVMGQNLFETLVLNLVQYPGPGDSPLDAPSWERDDPFIPERSKPLGRLDHLTWQSSKVFLFPRVKEGVVYVREAIRAPGLSMDREVLDPMKAYIPRENNPPLLVRFDPARALWSNGTALLIGPGKGGKGFAAQEWLAELVAEGHISGLHGRFVRALGMATEPGRQKVRFYCDERIPIPLAVLDNPGAAERLNTAVSWAQAIGVRLWGATADVASYILSPELADDPSGRRPDRGSRDNLMASWRTDMRYWAALEQPFRRVVEGLNSDGETVLEDWRKALLRAGGSTLDFVASTLPSRPRFRKAIVLGRRSFFARSAAVFEPRESTE